jgi:hypothetical protein
MSKTAMQELIEIMIEEWGEGRGLPEWLEKLLEKEKEQIIEAHGIRGWYKPEDKTSGITTGEEYYNQTYNQDK